MSDKRFYRFLNRRSEEQEISTAERAARRVAAARVTKSHENASGSSAATCVSVALHDAIGRPASPADAARS